MKTFIVYWKKNGDSQPFSSLIQGESWTHAVEVNFHVKSLNAIETYEEVSPYFIMVDHPGYPYPIPVTMYYTQHGNGRLYLKKVVSPLPTQGIKVCTGIIKGMVFAQVKQMAKEFARLVYTEGK